jgi:hypothetical protein
MTTNNHNNNDKRFNVSRRGKRKRIEEKEKIIHAIYAMLNDYVKCVFMQINC